MSKLLVHRIPKYIPSEELLKVIPGDFTIEIKVDHSFYFLNFLEYPFFAFYKSNYVNVH